MAGYKKEYEVKRIIMTMVLATLLAGTLAACATPAPTMTDDDQVAIYTAIAHRIYTVDHTFGDTAPNFPVVYLEGNANRQVRESVVAALADLPAEFIWIDSRDEVNIDDATGAVEGGAVIFTLGDIDLQEDGTVQAEGNMYFANLGGAWRTYVLDRVAGEWAVVGTAGPVAVS
jgi:hypothetical protein